MVAIVVGGSFCNCGCSSSDTPCVVCAIPVVVVTASGAVTVAAGTQYVDWVPSAPAQTTFTLPADPSIGDCYGFKDTLGVSGTYAMIFNGNGILIDGAVLRYINSNFGYLEIIYNGTTYALA